MWERWAREFDMVYLFAILVGVLAGFVNTLAGSGSLITLPMLMFLGLNATVANGTNRIGVLLGAMTATRTFHRKKILQLRRMLWLLVPAMTGAVGGAVLATWMDPKAMHHVIGGVLVLMLCVIVAKPKRWLVSSSQTLRPFAHWRTILIFAAVGVYGGFIQAGVGFFLLSGLVLYLRFNLVQANAIKVFMVMMFSIPALTIFATHHQVNWPLGLLVGSGQIVGAWAGAHFAAGHPNANLWIRRLLILIVLLAIGKLFGVLDPTMFLNLIK